MCYEPHLIFSCGCSEPMFTEPLLLRPCEWASLRGIPCPDFMISEAADLSVETWDTCPECTKRLRDECERLSPSPRFKTLRRILSLSGLKKMIRKKISQVTPRRSSSVDQVEIFAEFLVIMPAGLRTEVAGDGESIV